MSKQTTTSESLFQATRTNIGHYMENMKHRLFGSKTTDTPPYSALQKYKPRRSASTLLALRKLLYAVEAGLDRNAPEEVVSQAWGVFSEKYRMVFGMEVSAVRLQYELDRDIFTQTELDYGSPTLLSRFKTDVIRVVGKVANHTHKTTNKAHSS